MLYFKIDVLKRLKEKGINTTFIRKNNLIGQSALTQINNGIVPGTKTIDTLCRLLELQPGSIIGYRVEEDPHKEDPQ